MSFFDPIFILAILLSITVHEWAHAFTAYRLGDPTAKAEGRLTLSPIAHLDPLGAIMFLIVGFGWAKPVPVDSRFFKHPKRDLVLTALAGPLINLIVAFGCFVLIGLLAHVQLLDVESLLTSHSAGSLVMTLIIKLLQALLFLNLGLMAFNLLPIAPLDGSNILRIVIPYQYEDLYDRYLRMGPYVLLGLLLIDNLTPIPLLSGWIFAIVDSVLKVFALMPI